MLLATQEHRVHFDPVTSQEPSAVRPSHIPSTDLIEPELEPEEQEPRARAREGLPPAFRMRHGRHYVEQLMGDAPLRTVKEIAVSDIEPPPDDPADVQELEQSIRKLGVLEPLLVSHQGGAYRVIAGMNRLRAARSAGLRTVPCLVHDVDEETLKNMREAATQRATPPPPEVPVAEPPRDVALPPAFSEVTAGLKFVLALMPAITAAGDDRFRWSVLTDLAGIELLRARTVAAVAEVLASEPALNRREIASGDLLSAIATAVAPEARLRGVRVDAQASDPDYRIALDAPLVTSALTGLLQSMMTLLPDGGAIRLQLKGTMVRPALIAQLSQEEVDLGAEGVRRYFEGDWRQHPAGAMGGLLSAGAARIARLHGGRIDVQSLPTKGSLVTFVIPKPLENSEIVNR
jgi:hypothetical protein